MDQSLIPKTKAAGPSCKQRATKCKQRATNLLWRKSAPLRVPATNLLSRMVSPLRDPRDVGSSPLVNCAMSADLSHIVTTCEDLSMRVWSKVDGYWECESKWHPHDDLIESIDIVADGSRIVSASCDQSIKIWSKKNGLWVEEQTIWAKQEIWTCYFQADSVLVQGGMEEVVRLYEQQEGEWKQTQHLKGHGECISDCAFSGDMKTAVSAGYTLCLWHSDGGWHILDRVSVMTKGTEWDYEVGYLNNLAMSDDASIIVITYREPKCYCSILMIKEDKFIRTQQIEIGKSIQNNVCLALSETASFMMLTQSAGHGVVMWLREGNAFKEHQVLRGHTDQVTCVFCNGNESAEEMICTASNDKTFMIWRYDSAVPESHAYKSVHIRDATDVEMFKPMMLILMALGQKVAMAFAKEIPWNRATVRPLVVPLQTLTMFDFSFSVHVEVIFWCKSIVTLLAMIVFFVAAWLGRPQPAVLVLSTFAVVPFMKQVGLSLACDTEGVVIAAPMIVCFQGIHLYYAISAVMLSTMYLLLLLPFTAAEGDAEIMPRYIWLRPRDWVVRKTDKATGLDLGLWRADGLGSFFQAYADVFAKIALPLIGVFCYDNPMKLVALSLLSVTPSLISTVAVPPKKDRLIIAALITTESMVVFAYLAALNSVIVDDASSIWPSEVFFGGMVLIAVCFLAWVFLNVKKGTAKPGSGLDVVHRWLNGTYVPPPKKKPLDTKFEADDDTDSDTEDGNDDGDDEDSGNLPDEVGKHPKTRILDSMAAIKSRLR